MNWKPLAFGGAGLVLLLLLWLRYRRETPGVRTDEAVEADAGTETFGGIQVPPATYRTGGPWLTVTLRPVRAGLNMVTAVADCEISITNEGGAPAEAVRVALSLLAAHAGQHAEIATANAEPITRPVAPIFMLQPGETRIVRGVASAHLQRLPTMQAGGRDMLVPLVLVNVQHRDADGVEHRTAQGFVVGVERVDSSKLAPFWLDTIRMTDHVAARPSGAPERRRLA